MKMILCLAAIASCVLAEEPVLSKDDCKAIYQANVVDASDTQAVLDMYAVIIGQVCPTSLSKEELIQMMKENLTENQDSYLGLVTEKISPTNVQNVKELLANPLYMSYRNELSLIQYGAIQKAYMAACEKAKECPAVEVVVDVVHPIIELSKTNFEQVASGSKYVVIDVYADWCQPCKMLAPILQDLANTYGKTYTFSKLNCNEDNSELSTQLNIKSLPTLLFYIDGKEVTRKSGFMDKSKLEELIKATFSE